MKKTMIVIAIFCIIHVGCVWCTPLHRAARNGDVPMVQNLIQAGADEVNAKGSTKLTPLHVAAQGGHVPVVQILLRAGAQVDANDNDGGSTPLHSAALGGHVPTVQHLHEHGAQINAKDNFGKTPLHVAARRGRVPIVQYLLEHGASVDARDNSGKTPLHAAAWCGHVPVMQYLLKKGTQVNSVDSSGNTPLLWTVQAPDDNKPAVKELLEHGADVDQLNNFGATSLHLAAKSRHSQMAKVLLENGAPVDVKDHDGETPLHSAVQDGCLKTVKCLLEKGAPVDARDNSGKTSLHYAVKKRASKAVQYLLEKGAQINSVDSNGNTLLHLAVQVPSDNGPVVKVLLENGAPVNARNENGKTALHDTALRIRVKTAKYLLEGGAQVDLKDNNEASPLQCIPQSRRDKQEIQSLLEAADGSIESMKNAKQNKYPAIFSSLFLHFSYGDIKKNIRELEQALDTQNDKKNAEKIKFINKYTQLVEAQSSGKWNPSVAREFLKYVSNKKKNKPQTAPGKELKELYAFLTKKHMYGVKQNLLGRLDQTAALSELATINTPQPHENKAQKIRRPLPDEVIGKIATFIR